MIFGRKKRKENYESTRKLHNEDSGRVLLSYGSV